jgi:hypothetical protein
MGATAALPPFVLARQQALISRDWASLERLLDPALRYVHATGVCHETAGSSIHPFARVSRSSGGDFQGTTSEQL